MQSQTYKKKLSFTNPLIRSNRLLLFTCSLAVLPVCVCAKFYPPHRLQIRSTPQRITVTENHTHLFYTVNTSTHSILHIYTPCLLICSVLVCLFCFVFLFKVCVSRGSRSHHAQTCLTQQDMSVTGRIWKHG